MKRIGLVVKQAQPEAMAAAEDLRSWLVQREMEVFIEEAQVIQAPVASEIEVSTIPPDMDLVVVLGGDGTLLYAARALGRNGVPLLGINMGGLGFLTETSLVNLHPTMERVLSGDYTAEARMMLSVVVDRAGRTAARETVLNDVVIHKEALARILDLRVRINDMDLTSYRADGLIISSPTGSTAYNLSAGGPIVHPAQETIILTPICPFTLSNRPIILPETAIVEVEVDPKATDVILTADGQVSCALEPGDKVVVSRSPNDILLITNLDKDYFEIIRTKLGWG
ncbi:MAG: NAD(+)/NADH kinase [Thermodesulfobacteriota bacterium]|nr:NAD(+)/NADH kinase [Thermodesulfobacteriota bacterium]